jgi:pyridoxal phosphate enzyme (YggS family)
LNQSVTQITEHLAEIQRRIELALKRSRRPEDSVTVVAISKRHPTSAIRAAAAAGLRHFGENYLQEALPKIESLADAALEWHFVGQVQSNKTRPIAEHFDWVDTVDRARIAERLSDQRPDTLPPLNVLIQLNLDAEPQKGGVVVENAILPLAERIEQLPRLRLRGVMAMPPADFSPDERRASFLSVAAEAAKLKSRGLAIDVISMGMSADFETAIEAGSNCVRIGTALFGERPPA